MKSQNSISMIAGLALSLATIVGLNSHLVGATQADPLEMASGEAGKLIDPLAKYKIIKVRSYGMVVSEVPEMDRMLLDAAKYGKSGLVRLCLQQGVSPNAQDYYGQTPLIYASRYGHMDIVQMLLSKGADPNITDSGGETALMNASLNGSPEVVRLLLDAGAKRENRNSDGETALDLSKQHGHAEVSSLLNQEPPAKKSRVLTAEECPACYADHGDSFQVLFPTLYKAWKNGTMTKAQAVYYKAVMFNWTIPRNVKVESDINVYHSNLAGEKATYTEFYLSKLPEDVRAAVMNAAKGDTDGVDQLLVNHELESVMLWLMQTRIAAGNATDPHNDMSGVPEPDLSIYKGIAAALVKMGPPAAPYLKVMAFEENDYNDTHHSEICREHPELIGCF